MVLQIHLFPTHFLLLYFMSLQLVFELYDYSVCHLELMLNDMTGVSSLGVPGVPWHPQILADHLTLSQPGGRGK